nr:hypothetical protein [Spirochaetota bacterium]
MNGIPLTRYQVTRITYYAKFALISLAAVFLLGNTIKAIIKDRVTVNPVAYELKDGFPLFLDDSFLQYDDKRLEGVMAVLSALADRHQILLFSCH